VVFPIIAFIAKKSPEKLSKENWFGAVFIGMTFKGRRNNTKFYIA
jgi:hypothetical protein